LGAISKGVREEIAGGGAAPPKPERGRESQAFPGRGREEKKGGRHGHGENGAAVSCHGHGPRRGRPKELLRAG
jgi:hypothetical protein